MITYFDYSDVITQSDCFKARQKIDSLIDSGNWCKDYPKYQTYPNLYTYDEFNIFTSTFINACEKYIQMKNFSHEYNFIKMWSLKMNENDELEDEGWHTHGSNMDISGVYYLINHEGLGTRFKDEQGNIIEYEAKPYTWLIFQSDLLHSPPIVSRKERYVLAADIYAKI